MVLYQITAPHFVAGLEARAEDDVVVAAAPILKWSIGANLHYVDQWARRKGYEIKRV